MKILFTADIHIKLGQKNVPVEWAKNRYRLFFEQLALLTKKYDVLIIGGDIFDKLPSMDELELYFQMLDHIHCTQCVIYSGNHEALKKDTTFLSHLAEVTVRVTEGRAKVYDRYTTITCPDGSLLDILPYNELKAYHPADMLQTADILCTHVRGEIPPHVKPEVDLDIFLPWKIVLAGDLHSYENSQRNILYPGSPMTTSFHRNEVDTGIIVLDTETLEHKWIRLELPQLLRKTVKAGDPMPAGTYHHIVYEVEGDLSELASVTNTELVDKKLVKRESDSALILDANMTIQQEAEEYLRYVLGLGDDVVIAAIKELHNYVK